MATIVSAQSAAATEDCAAWGCLDIALCGSSYCRRHHVQVEQTRPVALTPVAPDRDDDLVVDDHDDEGDGATLATLAGQLVRSSKNLDRALRVRASARLDAQEALAEFNRDLRAIRERAERMLKR